MSLPFLGFGGWNKVVNLNMVVLLDLRAGRLAEQRKQYALMASRPWSFLVLLVCLDYAATSLCKEPISWEADSRDRSWKVGALKGPSREATSSSE
jgi:hypothetical protein